MSTIETLSTQFNGVIDTTQPVMRNLETLCTAARCWLTFDINTGKWAVVINTTGTSVASFNNSNIIGGINVSGTGLTELYNKVRVEFPHVDLNDEKDWISIAIPTVDRFNNEHDNTLEMSLDIVNDPIWTEMLASTELKQSRVDKIIEFRTDYSKLGLKAGDLIDVTADMYGYTNKMFRIVSIAEEDADDGTIQLSITALEYDADVYNYSNLNLYQRERSTGIKPDSINTAIIGSNNIATTTGVKDSLLDPANVALAALLFSAMTPKSGAPGFPLLVYDYTDSSPVALQNIAAGLTDQAFQDISLTHSLVPAGQYIDFGPAWTVPFTGTYKFASFIRFLVLAPLSGGNFTTLPTLSRSQATLKLSINGGDYESPGNLAANIYNAKGGPVNIVFNLTGLYNLTQGQNIQFKLCCAGDWGAGTASPGIYILSNVQAYYTGT